MVNIEENILIKGKRQDLVLARDGMSSKTCVWATAIQHDRFFKSLVK